jgi:hypothetical protein
MEENPLPPGSGDGEPNRPPATWSTGDEIDFLEGLGNWKGLSKEDPHTRRLNLLRNYQRSMRNRRNWDRIDWVRIGTFLTEVLEGRSF